MIRKLLCNNYVYYSIVTVIFLAVCYGAYIASSRPSKSGLSFIPNISSVTGTKNIGGTPPYYEGHDDVIEPNPNK